MMSQRNWRFLQKIVWGIMSPFWNILGFIPAIRSLQIDTKIRALEQAGNLDDARILRQYWLKKLPFKHTAPLWRSEGMDQLYRQHHVEHALEAFEQAANVLTLHPANTGVTNPLHVYIGASKAAIMLGNADKAKTYYQQLVQLMDVIRGDTHSFPHLNRYEEDRVWLEHQIFRGRQGEKMSQNRSPRSQTAEQKDDSARKSLTLEMKREKAREDKREEKKRRS